MPIIILTAYLVLSLTNVSVRAADTLSGDEIRQQLVGNTLTFFSQPNKADIFLRFDPDGSALGVIDDGSGRKPRQEWWINENNMLCRAFGAPQKKVCNTIRLQGEKLVFLRPNGRKLFEARLLRGDQLPVTAASKPAQGGPTAKQAKGGATPAKKLNRMDKDGDGKIHRDEFAGPANRFSAIDTDQDGYLTAQEMSAFAKPGSGKKQKNPEARAGKNPTAAAVLDRLDKNSDGVIDLAELDNDKKKFKRLDKNGDKKITKEDLELVAEEQSKAPGYMKAAMQTSRLAQRTPRRKEPRICENREQTFTSGHFTIQSVSPGCVFPGTVLFIDKLNREFPKLIEMDLTGKIVWSYNFGTTGVSDFDKHPAMDPSRLTNGNTLFALKNWGVFEVDRSGTVVWKHLDRSASHDVDRLANGNTIYVRAWTDKGTDQVREVNPDGKIVWSWKGLGDFDTPEFAPRVSPQQGEPGNDGWIHTNSVIRLADGRTLVSLTNFSQIVYVNHEGKVLDTVPILGTHGPKILDNGNLLVASPGGNPSIIEFSDGRPVWHWDHRKTPQKNLKPNIWLARDVIRLPNGNTFLTTGARLLELDAAGEIVWQLRYTDPGVEKDQSAREFYKSQRIGPDGHGYGD
ncbi:MAG: EF-hand domain-containing protein [Rhodospirillales bacterium]|nr:EF-hand domain-containing protein [Rhodospirillales bacterium]